MERRFDFTFVADLIKEMRNGVRRRMNDFVRFDERLAQIRVANFEFEVQRFDLSCSGESVEFAGLDEEQDAGCEREFCVPQLEASFAADAVNELEILVPVAFEFGVLL